MSAATETAAARQPAATAGIERVPSVPLPRGVQTVRFVARQISFLEHWRWRLGDTFRGRLYGPGDVVFVSDPDSIKRLFKADRENTIAPGRSFALRPLLGPGSLLLQSGEQHLRRRRLMLPPFHGERMRSYESLIREATERTVARWTVGCELALHPEMQAITLEVILRAVFGVEDAGRRERLRDGLVEVLTAVASPTAVFFATPGVRRLPPYRRLPALRGHVDELLRAEIAEHRRRPDLAERYDILSMLLEARFDDGSAMTDEEIRDQLMTLLVAGHETTATGLAWTFDLVLHDRAVLARLRAERADGDHTYLDAVICEALRIRPVVPFTGRQLRRADQLDGYALPPGTVVLAAIYLAHTRPATFPEPYRFSPERFLDPGVPDTYSWIPFGGGTRRCIGAAFAQLEMRVVLESILNAVELRPASPELERPARRNITLSPANGTRALVERRR